MFAFLKKSKLVALVAQAAVVVGALDLASIAHLVPSKIGAALVVIGGIAAQINQSLNPESSTGGN